MVKKISMAGADVKEVPEYPAVARAWAEAPRVPGVYLFKDAQGRIIYVGKAVNLRNRLASYLRPPGRHDPKTALMLRRTATVDFLLTGRGRAALILERNLIKEHTPRFNVRLRDDKNYLCLRLDLKEEYPSLSFVRRFFRDGALYFGPYTSAAAARETLKLMKQVFGLRTCKEKTLAPRSRPCLEGQMGRCLAPCTGVVSREDYQQAVQQAVQFLKGRSRQILNFLKEEMDKAAAQLNFERAALLRDRLQAVRRTLEHQDMARPTFRDQDVVGVAQTEKAGLVQVLFVRGGLVTGHLDYYFPELPLGGDLLGDFLKQYYSEERPIPDEILLPYDHPDRRVLAEVLGEQKGKPVRLVVVKGPWGKEGPPGAPTSSLSDRARLMTLAQENAWAALRRRQSQTQRSDPLEDLKERLNLSQRPRRLECLDISTHKGGHSVGALVAFVDGKPDKSGYRRFRIREVAGQDDYAMLQEVVRRHYGKGKPDLPDLLVVDGGKGQLQVVKEALKDLGLNDLPVVALAKAASSTKKEVPDRLFLPGRKNPKILPSASPGGLLLMRLRDEAHRFAITYHRRRARRELTLSALRQVPGLGPVRCRLLWQHFGDLETLKKATPEELQTVARLPRKVALALKDWLAGPFLDESGRTSPDPWGQEGR
jgi:excinuclease ABC subunit C